ncbi:hypothetical protein N658DRAFT_34344 [Parathielavia hyrcaniae]|uniref:Uncharacterized protein n=1 Tax=Parathielavia hyrcaniae TaxID=113614 RepID=A0AAN6QEU8_9PEZI|nr:hypothetical protein N658DRAFT_34344 [Parathielavia hyrcaniae]
MAKNKWGFISPLPKTPIFDLIPNFYPFPSQPTGQPKEIAPNPHFTDRTPQGKMTPRWVCVCVKSGFRCLAITVVPTAELFEQSPRDQTRSTSVRLTRVEGNQSSMTPVRSMEDKHKDKTSDHLFTPVQADLARVGISEDRDLVRPKGTWKWRNRRDSSKLVSSCKRQKSRQNTTGINHLRS